MKTSKITVSIVVEVLSIDSVPGLLYQVAELISTGEEKVSGNLRASDGDEISWETTSKEVKF
jgi:hypothetical protein